MGVQQSVIDTVEEALGFSSCFPRNDLHGQTELSSCFGVILTP